MALTRLLGCILNLDLTLPLDLALPLTLTLTPALAPALDSAFDPALVPALAWDWPLTVAHERSLKELDSFGAMEANIVDLQRT